MPSNNNPFRSLESVKLEDIYKAAGKLDSCTSMKDALSYVPLTSKEFLPVSGTSFQGNVMRTQNYKTDFDQDIWTIEVPGIKREDIEVFTHKSSLFVVIDGPLPEKLTRPFNEDDTVSSVKLEFGVLTLVIDHFEKKKPIKVS